MNRLLQIGLILAVSLHAFDEMALVIALPSISSELGGEVLYGVTLSSYVLAAMVATAWSGDWIDRHGPFGAFQIAITCFFVGLLMAIMADTIFKFIIARVLQGIGGGIVFTLAYAVTNRLCPIDLKSRMVAWLDSAWLLPSLLAPALGGFLVEHWSWRGLFWLQLPVLFAIVLILFKPLKLLRLKPTSLDFSGLWTALRIGICCALVVALTSTPLNQSWLFLAPIIWLIWRPLSIVLPYEWWKLQTPLALSIILLGGLFFVFYGVESYTPLYLIEYRGMGVTETGLVFTCAAFTWVLASFLQSTLDRYFSHRHSLLSGALVFLVAFFMMALVSVNSIPIGFIYSAWGLMGFAMGLTYNTLVTSAMLATQTGHEGATAGASGLMGSLCIGLAAGLGGAIKNQVEYRSGDVGQAMDLIGMLMLAVLGVLILIIWRRFPKEKIWYQSDK